MAKREPQVVLEPVPSPPDRHVRPLIEDGPPIVAITLGWVRFNHRYSWVRTTGERSWTRPICSCRFSIIPVDMVESYDRG